MTTSPKTGSMTAAQAAQQQNRDQGGQYATKAHTPPGPGATLAPAQETVESIASSPEYASLVRDWQNAPIDPDVDLMAEIEQMGHRIVSAAEPDRPGIELLEEALAEWQADEVGDPVTCTDIVEAMQTVTAKSAMRVVEDGHGGHLRALDRKPAHTCPDCGNGYATGEVLMTHREQDCDGAIDQMDADFDADAHDALHDAAESFASEINNAGRAEQVAFLRRMGVSDDEILPATQDDEPDLALDEMVLGVASQTASQAYNDGETDGSAVTEALEGKRWMLSGQDRLMATGPLRLLHGECTDVRFRDTDGTTVTYRVSYHEWQPDGDDGTPATGYLRGEYRAETEWSAYRAPHAEETSPFRPSRGETMTARQYAWEQFEHRLKVEAKLAAQQKRTDPLRSFIEG